MRTTIFLCAIAIAQAATSVLDFYIDDDASQHDDTFALQAAIDHVVANGGGIVAIPAGAYSITNVHVGGHGGSWRHDGMPGDYVILRGEGRATRLNVVGANPHIAAIEFQGSHGGIEDLQMLGDGNTTAIHIGPNPNSTTNATLTMTNYNKFSNLYIHGFANGIVMDAGPGGACTKLGDSGAWYNVFSTILMMYVRRGIWLRPPQYCNFDGSSVNRNQFYSVRIGQFVNTGVQIDAGDTNTFYGCAFEGISVGTEPNDPPVAIKIQKSSLNTTGADNNGNGFFGAKFEGNTYDVWNDNAYTVFFGDDISDVPKLNRFGVRGAATPLIFGGESAGGYAGGGYPLNYGCVAALNKLTSDAC